MTEKDLKLLKLRNNIIDNFLEAWNLIYDDDILQDLCLLTERIIYKNDTESSEYITLRSNFIDDIMELNEYNHSYYTCDDETDMRELMEGVLDECIE